ncbi:hypothetical protein EFB14_17380 [Rhizobium fabae]|uniref:Uncharacterized protein n=1 Tax=Rhizobium fabae TaxID=573179 RepID=A0ABY0B6T9_9HYPH|nr:hypothetical protein EFB14_17380 [Rhizobium fabae]
MIHQQSAVRRAKQALFHTRTNRHRAHDPCDHAPFLCPKSKSSCIDGPKRAATFKFACHVSGLWFCATSLNGRYFRHPRAGKTRPRPQFIPLDLNYPDGVQIFAMAFAERIPMVPITRRAAPRTRA